MTSSAFKSNNSLIKELLGLIRCKRGHWDKKVNKCVYDSSIKSHYNYLRNLLQNDTFSRISFKEELTNFEKHIRLVIILACVIVSVLILIGSVFLIKYLKKKCKKMKEEEEVETDEENNTDISNPKIPRKHKDNMTYEMKNIYTDRNNFLRGSNPCHFNRNKTFSSNPVSTNNKKRGETIEEEDDEYCNYTFKPNTEYVNKGSKEAMDSM